MATMWKRLEKKSRDGYVAGFRRYLGVLCRRPDLGVRGALEETLPQVVRAGHYEGPIKKILAGLRIVEKSGRIPTVGQPRDWQMVKVVEKLRIRRMGVQIRWAPSSIFPEVVAKRATLSWAEAETLAILAILASTNVLRISEAITICRKEKGVMEFYGVKNRVGWHGQPVGPLATQWLEFIHMGRQRQTGRTEYSGNFGSVEELEASFKLLVAPTTWPELRWHSLRRLGAAQLWANGCRGGTLQLAGGWKTPTVALHYATPGHSWIFEDRGRQPVPVVEGDEIHTRMGTWSSTTWWAAWIRKDVRDSGLGRRDGETLGGEKQKATGAKRQRTRGASDSEVRERAESREEDNSEGEYRFGDSHA
uniref:Uncharacterized protein n=1 Tax=Eutreptiella gymnastica TaxID=73025 RepID=A0A7S4LMB7_9EUGL